MTERPHRPDRPARTFDRWGYLAVAAVLIAAFITGGGSMDRGPGDVFTQLLALPLLCWASLAIHASTVAVTGVRRGAIAVALSIAAILALQQLPLPDALWRSIDVRDALSTDLRTAGVTDARHAWSLSPLASERGLWSILPALAVFLGVLVVPARQHRRLLLLVVLLSAASLLLGYLQLGAGQDSVLNPFPEWEPALNGFFSSPNHQATLLAVSVVSIAALLMDDWRRDGDEGLPRWLRFSLAATGLLLFASLPLTGARAALLLAVAGLVAVPVVLSLGRRGATSSKTISWGRRAAFLVLTAGVITVAVGWLRFDMAEEFRWSAAKATLEMGTSQAPLGAGLGSFVSWFEQNSPAPLFQGEYFNHAHNEYAQWWLESGVPGVLVILAVFAILLACMPRPQRHSPQRDQRGVAVAAWLGCVLILLHSIVDYPLRTPTLMTVAALLAGIAVGQHVASGARRRRRSVTGEVSGMHRRVTDQAAH